MGPTDLFCGSCGTAQTIPDGDTHHRVLAVLARAACEEPNVNQQAESRQRAHQERKHKAAAEAAAEATWRLEQDIAAKALWQLVEAQARLKHAAEEAIARQHLEAQARAEARYYGTKLQVELLNQIWSRLAVAAGSAHRAASSEHGSKEYANSASREREAKEHANSAHNEREAKEHANSAYNEREAKEHASREREAKEHANSAHNARGATEYASREREAEQHSASRGIDAPRRPTQVVEIPEPLLFDGEPMMPPAPPTTTKLDRSRTAAVWAPPLTEAMGCAVWPPNADDLAGYGGASPLPAALLR